MKRTTWAAILILLAASLFNVAVLWPEVAVDTPALNDETLHVALVARAAEALDHGQDPTDPWVSYFVEGYPLFHSYQHLPHVATAMVFKALGGAVPLSRLMDVIRLLLLSTFPLSLYWTGRRLGLAAVPSALGGLVSSLLATNGLYGLDWASYLWRGYGLYTQLWGMWLLGPAIGGLWATLCRGRARAGTAALLAGVLLSHLVLGYAALLSGGLFLFLGGRREIGPRLKRLAPVALLVAAVTAYFLVPFVLDRAYVNRSVWEDPGKYDAYGWEWTLSALVRGDVLDYGRFPGLTLLGGLGLFVCLVRWRQDERYRLLATFFLAWLLLYFGRPTWGVLLELLPLSADLHLHRLLALVHLGAIGLIAVGATWLFVQAATALTAGGWCRAWRLAAAGVPVVLLAPVYLERIGYAGENGRWLRENAVAFRADGGQMEALLADLAGLPAARVYAGRGGNWGKEYTIGSVPVYALLAEDGFDSPGYLYHALSLNADIEGYLDEARPAALNLFNIGYAIVPQGHAPPAGGELLRSYGRHQLYRVPTTGYFDLVDSDVILYGPRSAWFDAARSWLGSGLVEARQHPRIVFGAEPAGDGRTVSLTAAPELLGGLDLPRREPCGQMIAEQVEGNAYYAEFQANRACWLMLKATYHPGWEAQVDGRRVQTNMLAPSFTGVEVQAGHHQVQFVYRPGPLRRVLLIAGAAVLLVAAAVEWQRARLAALFRRVAASLPVRRARHARGAGAARSTSRFRLFRRSFDTRYGLRISPFPLLVLLFALLAGLPLLQLKQMSGHDAFEYLPRTIEYLRGLLDGQIPPRWAPDLSAGYGQPFFLFNPPLIYALASAFHGLGWSVLAGLNLACLALLALAGLGMYLYAREFFGRLGGAVAGAAYVMAPFALANLYVRQALSDFSAMALIPWSLWGLYRWILPRGAGESTVASTRRRARHLAVAAGAVALILLASNPVSLIAVPMLVAYTVFLGWRARTWRAVGAGLAAVGLGLAASAFFWLPALLERQSVHTGNLLAGYLNYRTHLISLHQLISSPWGYGLSTAGTDDGMSFALGPVHLALLACSLLLAWRWRKRLRGRAGGLAHFWFFVAVMGLAAFLVTDSSIWLWDRLPLLQYLEFPWRILVLAAASTAFSCAFPLLAVYEPRRRTILGGVILAGLLLAGMARARPESYYVTTDAEFAPPIIAASGLEVTTAREYEPVWVETRPNEAAPENRLLIVDGQVRVLKSELSSARCEWTVEADGATRLQAAVFYYPGWRLTVDGEERPIIPAPGTGLIPLALDSGRHEVVLEFRNTPLRTWAVVVSVGGGVLLGALCVWLTVGRRRAVEIEANVKC